jgi:uncharacterized protein with von Willebrand factor type A (vWA) domain
MHQKLLSRRENVNFFLYLPDRLKIYKYQSVDRLKVKAVKNRRHLWTPNRKGKLREINSVLEENVFAEPAQNDQFENGP